VRDDPHGGALSDSDFFGDFAHPGVRVARQAK
jgi:hypothetical protein